MLENAITQSSVLGKDQADEAVSGAPGTFPYQLALYTCPIECPTAEEDAKSSGAFLSFSGDAEEGEDVPVDLFGEAAKAVEAAEEDDDENEYSKHKLNSCRGSDAHRASRSGLRFRL